MKIANRRARYNYKILEAIEVGIVLSGAEVKSLREGRGSLEESFARIKDSEVWLFNFVIPVYRHADSQGYNPTKPRKLLLHKREILALTHKMEGKSLTLVPLACYTTGRLVKIKLGLGKGKREYEKREVKRKRDLEREIAKALKSRK